jgi:hypothetical protein
MRIFIRGFNGAVFRRSGLINLKNDPNLSIFKKLIDKLNKSGTDVTFFEDISSQTRNSKIFFFDFPYSFNIREFIQLLNELDSKRNQKILVLFEPPVIAPLNYFNLLHKFFNRIYTWNDDLVDNIKYFKYHWPQSTIGYNTVPKPFKSKKFITLINGNKTPLFSNSLVSIPGKELYSERVKAIEFFEKEGRGRFDLYGRGWNKNRFLNIRDIIFGARKYKTFRGSIKNKLEVLSRYKYCICYENMTDINGYITEKIFDCFKAKTVPVYFGANNIEQYIPINCFIDFRKFKSYDSLLRHIGSITEAEYSRYIENIEKLLDDKSFYNRWFGPEFLTIFQR